MPTAETVAQAGDSAKGHDDLPKLREAVDLLAQARNPDARNYEVEWKLARYNYFLGKLTTDVKESEKAFENGETAGQIAAQTAMNKVIEIQPAYQGASAFDALA